MKEWEFTKLAEAMQGAGDDIRQEVLASSRAAIALMSASGAKKGLRDGIDIHGRPFLPLRHERASGKGGMPLRDKGLLAASISATMPQETVILSANSPGARLQNYGGIVRPKKAKAKALAIPVSKEAGRVGSPGGGRFPRPLFFRATKSASSVGVLCESVGGVLVVHYVLVKEVRIPARQFLGWSAPTLDRIQQLLADKYASAIVKLFNAGDI